MNTLDGVTINPAHSGEHPGVCGMRIWVVVLAVQRAYAWMRCWLRCPAWLAANMPPTKVRTPDPASGMPSGLMHRSHQPVRLVSVPVLVLSPNDADHTPHVVQGTTMFAPDLTAAIDTVTPPGLTHIGIVLKNSDDALLVTEPQGHPDRGRATFHTVKLGPSETPSAALARCFHEQVGASASARSPCSTVWATNTSRGFSFAGRFDSQPKPSPNRVVGDVASALHCAPSACRAPRALL